MSRFILDLVAITLDRDESGSSSRWSAVRFASVAESIVGTFGADVADGGDMGWDSTNVPSDEPDRLYGP